jgi:hypothetical protein
LNDNDRFHCGVVSAIIESRGDKNKRTLTSPKGVNRCVLLESSTFWV